MEKVIRAAILCVVVLFAGCRFEQPLTSSPSKNLNTWLLGVWETQEKDGAIQRATLTPKDSGRYWLRFQKISKAGKTTTDWLFDAWISRVGRSNFLTLRMQEGGGEFAPGTFAFVHYQVLNQNQIRVRIPSISSPPSASSFALRKEIRQRQKAGTLYDNDGTEWNRVSEVYWSGNSDPQPPQPLRFPEYRAGRGQ